jgi:hypothetical protein
MGKAGERADSSTPSVLRNAGIHGTAVGEQTSDEDDGHACGSEGCAGEHACHLPAGQLSARLRNHAIRLRLRGTGTTVQLDH